MSPRLPVRRRTAALAAVCTLIAAGAAGAQLVPLPGPLGQVNDDPAAGIDPAKGANAADVVGGSLAPGGTHVPWAVFEQQTTGATQIFSRSYANGVWTTRGNPASLNIDPAKDGEAPSIDFAGAGRTVPWVSWYEESSEFGGATNIFASRFDAAGNRWLPAGQDRAPNKKLPSLNINTDRDAENPAVFGGATTAGNDPVPWVAWQEKDGSDQAQYQRDQIFVSRGVKAAPGQTDCTGFSPGSGPVVNGFCWQEVGIPRVSRTSLQTTGATDPSLNVDTTREGIEPDAAFTGPGDTVPWVVWYEKGPSGRGLRDNEMVFAAKAVKDDSAKGGFHWVTVGRGGSGILDASATGGPCSVNTAALDGCSLNANPASDAEDPRIAAGTMTPGTPTAPWVVFSETNNGYSSIYVARLVGGDRFVLVNGGKGISTPGVNAEGADITFAGNTPVVSWREGKVLRTGHFVGPASDPVFVSDDQETTEGTSALRTAISSNCPATPATADGANCAGTPPLTPVVLFGDGRTGGERLLARSLVGVIPNPAKPPVTAPPAAPPATPTPPATGTGTKNLAPRVSLTGFKARVLLGRNGRITIRLRLRTNEAARVTVQLRKRGKVLAATTVRRTKPGAFTVRLRVRGVRPGSLTLRIAARDSAGATRVTTRSMRVVAR